MDEFNQKLQNMIVKYGKETMDRVRGYASIVYCDYDLTEIQNIISLENTYGLEKVKTVFDMISSFKSKSTSKKA
jgi:hypothetical protein